MVAANLRVRRDGRLRSPVVTTAVLVASVVVAVHVVAAASFDHEALPAASPEAYLPLWALVLSGTWLALGVVAAWVSRAVRPGAAVGLAAATVGAALPAWASWTGLPTTVRSAVLSATALTAAGLAQVVPRWRAERSWLGRLAWGLGGAAVLVHVIAYDPFEDLHCTRGCRSVAGPWWEEPASETVVAVEGLLVLASIVVGLAGVVAGRSVPTAVRAATAISIAVVAAAVIAELGWRDSAGWARTTSTWLPWALGPTASAACLLAVRDARTRRALESLLVDLEDGQTAGVHYAVPGEDRWVDGTGRDVADDASMVVVLSDDDGPSVRLADPRADRAAAELSPSRALALTNARLNALAAARLADVRASQRRTVQRADAERHRIERDLHDGAQQALVSAAFHLSAAAHRTRTRTRIDEAQAHVTAALAGLRELVHGPVPEVLLNEGVRAALEDLAAEARNQVDVEVHGEVEPAADVAIAAFLCVAALVEQAEPDPCRVEVDLTDAGTRVVVRGSGGTRGPLDQILLDRIGALGGTVIHAARDGRWSCEVWLPCGS